MSIHQINNAESKPITALLGQPCQPVKSTDSQRTTTTTLAYISALAFRFALVISSVGYHRHRRRAALLR